MFRIDFFQLYGHNDENKHKKSHYLRKYLGQCSFQFEIDSAASRLMAFQCTLANEQQTFSHC